MNKKRMICAVASSMVMVVGLLVATPNANAALLAYDGVSGYNTGVTLNNQTMGGFGWDDDWDLGNGTSEAVDGGGLSFGALTVSGDQTIQQVGVNAYMRTALDTPVATGTIYMSVLASAATTSSSWGPAITVNQENVAVSVGLGKDDVTRFYVFEFLLGAVGDQDDVFSIYTNPDPSASQAANAGTLTTTSSTSLQGSANWVGTLTHFVARGGWAMTYDEIRFGDTFDDVTPVPEPTSFALASIGLLGFVGLLRRRRK